MARSRQAKSSSTSELPSAATAFFTAVAAQGLHPLLQGESGTLRFDLSGGHKLERWYVTLSDGVVTVSHRGGHAETVLRLDEALFDDITRGTTNALASQLRGDIDVEGDLHLLMVFQRLFPGPPSSTGRRPAIEGRTVTMSSRR